MKTYPLLYPDNCNSWHRIAMLARLYWPGLKLGFAVCAVFPLLVVFLSASFAQLTSHNVDLMFEWPISILYYLGPVMLTKRDYRDISSQLPVTTMEKLGFLLLTFWIAVPATIYLSGQTGEWLSVAVYGSQIQEYLHGIERSALKTLNDLGLNKPTVNVAMEISTTLSMITIVLYYVLTAKKNRVLAGFASMIAVQLLLGLFSGIMGGIMGFAVAYNSAAEGMIEEAVKASIVVQVTIWILSLTLILTLIIGAIYLVKTYKRLRNSGF